MSKRELVRLRDRYRTASRMTRWRMRNQQGFPAGVFILGTEYFYEDELEAYEEARRRQRSETRTPAQSHEPQAPSPALLSPTSGRGADRAEQERDRKPELQRVALDAREDAPPEAVPP
jgi:hypothetical protein